MGWTKCGAFCFAPGPDPSPSLSPQPTRSEDIRTDEGTTTEKIQPQSIFIVLFTCFIVIHSHLIKPHTLVLVLGPGSLP
jgi:hypothetical protein